MGQGGGEASDRVNSFDPGQAEGKSTLPSEVQSWPVDKIPVGSHL